MCEQPQPASRTPRRRQSWRHPTALTLLAWAGLLLLPPPAAAQTATVTITLSGPGAEVTEGGTATFTVTRAGDLSSDIRVPYVVSGVSLTDFEHPARDRIDPTNRFRASVLIPAEAASATLMLALPENDVVERNKTLQVELQPPVTGPDPVVFAPAARSAQVTLVNNDPVLIAARFNSSRRDEGQIPLELFLTVFNPGVLTSVLDVTYEIRGLGDTPAERARITADDFGALPGMDAPDLDQSDPPPVRRRVTIDPLELGSASVPRSLPINDDTRSEELENFEFRLVAADSQGGDLVAISDSRDRGRRPEAIGTIGDNDPELSLRGPVADVAEGDTATFTITREKGGGFLRLRVPYEVSGVDAGDFIRPSNPPTVVVDANNPLRGFVEFDGSTVSFIEIPLTIVDDNEPEGSERLTVTIGGAELLPTYQAGATPDSFVPVQVSPEIRASVAIPGLPTASIKADRDEDGFTEGGAGSASETSFTIALDARPRDDVTVMVPYQVSGVDAGRVCVQVSNGPCTILETNFSGTVAFSAAADPADADPLAVTLTLRARENALTQRPAAVRVTLLAPTPTGEALLASPNFAETVLVDNDPVVIFVTGSPPLEIDEGGRVPLLLRFVRGDVLSPVGVDVTYEIRGVGDTEEQRSRITAGDFGELPGQAGDPQNPLRRTLTIERDSIDFLPDTELGNYDLELPIRDDTRGEGDEAFEFHLVGIAARGQGAGDVVALAEASNLGNFAIQNPDLLFVRRTLRDDDVELSVSGPGAEVAEGGTAIFTVTRVGDLRPEMMVPYTIGGAGIGVGDFRVAGEEPPRGLAPRVARIGASARSATIPLEILIDELPESAETLTVTIGGAGALRPTLSEGASGTLSIVTADGTASTASDASASASVIIPARAAVPTPTIADSDVGLALRGAAEFAVEGSTAEFVLTRDGDLDPAVVVTYVVEGGEGIDAADYRDLTGGSVELRRGATEARIRIQILEDDDDEEGEETLRVRVVSTSSDDLGPGGSIEVRPDSAAVRIPQLRIEVTLSGPEQVQEGAVARFAVSLAVEPAGRATTEEVVLAYTLGLSGDSATREADYEAPPGGSGTLRIPAGGVAGTIEVPVLRDRVREGEEEFSLAWVPERSSGGGGAIRFAATRQTVRILDLTDEEEARREQRTRALLAATGRAAAHMATDVITARMSRGDIRAEASANANRKSSSDLEAADSSATLRAGAQPERIDREAGAHESQLSTQSDTDAAGRDTTAFATDALSTALRLTGLSPGSATPVGVDGTTLQPDAALFAGIDAPVGAVATGPTAPGSDDAQPGASAADLRDSGPRLPRLAELLRGVDFELRGSELGWDRLGEGLGIWGAGTFTSLEGDPDVGDGRLDYEGESYGLFVGADQRLELGAADAGRELLVGAALGWTRADLDYRDRPSSGFAVEGRFRSELLAIHPYASLRLSPRARLWLLAGYGGGDVEIEERESLSGGDALRRVKTDATMWMVSVGAEGRVPLPRLSDASQLLVRFFGTRTSGSLDRARFDDDALLRGTRARTWRVAGELEGGHRFAFAEGAHFRPFVTARLRGDAGDDLGDDWEFSVDLGGGAELAWPERGLSLGLRGTAQLNEGARHREHRVVVDLRYDLAGDGRGLTVEVENTLEGSGRLGARAEPGLGAAFSPGSYGGGGSLGALLQETIGEDLDAGAASALRHSIRGEIGYGLVAALPSWARGADGWGRGLLTPYARFDLAAGSQATAAGLRFEAPGGTRLGVEAGVDFHRRRGHTDTAATTSPVYKFLLTGELEF